MSADLLTRAAECIEREAAVIRQSYTSGPDGSDWVGAADERAEHDAMLALAAELRTAAAPAAALSAAAAPVLRVEIVETHHSDGLAIRKWDNLGLKAGTHELYAVAPRETRK